MSWNDFFIEVFRNILPKMAFDILVGLLIIFLGIALAFLIKGITLALLRVLKFEKLMEQIKLNHVFGKTSSTEILADFVEIVVVLAFIVQGFQFMGFYLLASALNSILAWTPKLLAAAFVLAIFFIVAKYLESKIIEAKLKQSDVISKYTFAAILTIGAVVSIRQLGIETQFIEQAILIVIFAFALAFALAVGISLGLGLKNDAKKLIIPETKKPKRKGRK